MSCGRSGPTRPSTTVLLTLLALLVQKKVQGLTDAAFVALGLAGGCVETDQYITRIVSGALLTERVLRLHNDFPTTLREKVLSHILVHTTSLYYSCILVLVCTSMY